MIRIGKPYLTKTEGYARVNCDCFVDEQKRSIFCEVEEKYADYLVYERADAFLYMFLPVAQRDHHDIVCEAPITEEFLHNINEMLLPSLAMGDKSIRAPKISAPTEPASTLKYPEGGGMAVGTGLSCGVDSFYTIYKYLNSPYKSMKLTHLYAGKVSNATWYSNTNNMEEHIKSRQEQYDKWERVATELGLPLVKTFSNIVENVLCDGYGGYKHATVHNYITMADVLCLKKLWKTYYFASTFPFTGFDLTDNSKNDTAHYELLSVHVLSIPGFSVYSSGVDKPRHERVLELSKYDLVRREVQPCWSKDGKNCSKESCLKCMRMLTTADMYGILDKFEQTFDIKRYKTRRVAYLRQLYIFKESSYYAPMYNYFKEKEPENMAEIEHYYDLKKMLSNQCNKEKLIDFFLFRNLKSIYIAGQSMLGNEIVKLLKENGFEILKHDKEVNNLDLADVCVVVSTQYKEIERVKNVILSRKQILLYTIDDIAKEWNA